MASHSSIILEYFDELTEIDKIEVVKDVINRFEKTLRPVQAVQKQTSQKISQDDGLIEVHGIGFSTIGSVFKHFGLKPANAYQKFRRDQTKFPEKSKSELLSDIVDEYQEKDRLEAIEKKPPLLRSHNGNISVG